MSDRTTEFFEALNRRARVPALEGVAGTIRFDLEHDHGVDHWFMTISRGEVRISRENRDADAVFRTSKELFDRFVTGDAHPYTAWVRNEFMVTGDVGLGRLFQRVLPARPSAHHPRTFARERSHQA